ncbi:universal stress protein [Nesterenkonia sp. LB17]|uniref:universal stress protein n=1 Tax=unclassified Nesterenkonia TaxID=2629769 RepID=UPI001F4CF1FA|nr:MULTISPECIES: universal stress protein [unclassified Nesterenkonia]MCH8560176.1 universal stress protein [Nesterenkonia sp. DZ6]MCH8563822.1 universal stress protein [Nesterenkonia sp. YGD6]MCH8565556.1 universal stress protein [Nesterenkonia sp. LB17]MCH8571642.1 universal stress protein [Nesterenkonia sp. AY15]
MAEKTIRRVAVGFGGDERSLDALALGIALARSAGARLDLILVIRQDSAFKQEYPPVGSVVGIIAEQAQQWIAEAEAVIPPEIRHHSHIRPAGSIAEGLVSAVQELDSDVLVTGSGIGFGRIMTHPAVTALLHSSPVPVALAPAGYRANTQITDVMAAVSAAHPDHQVTRSGESWAGQLGAALTFVTFEDKESGPARHDAGKGPDADAGTASAEPIKHILATGRTLRHAVGTVDWPQGGILLIGSSPLARRRHIFLGMTAARVLSHLPIPMVLLPRDPDTSAPAAR